MDPLTILAILGAVGAVGSAGASIYKQRDASKTARAQIASNEALARIQAEATKRMTEESKAKAKEYMQALLKMKKDERAESQKQELMRSFMGSQDRQAAMLMSAMQGISSAQAPPPNYGGGMVGLMRGNF